MTKNLTKHFVSLSNYRFTAEMFTKLIFLKERLRGRHKNGASRDLQDAPTQKEYGAVYLTGCDKEMAFRLQVHYFAALKGEMAKAACSLKQGFDFSAFVASA